MSVMPLVIENARHLYDVCPLCDSPLFKQIGSAECSSHPLYSPELPKVIHWMQCLNCSHSFTDGHFTEKSLEILFSKANDYQVLNLPKIEQARAVSATMVDKISMALGEQSGRWLDVGFGNGALLLTCAEYGFDSIGLDLRQQAVDKIKEMGIEAYCQDLLKFDCEDQFSVISMADVLEHMPFPKKALAKAYEMLAPKGILFVTCPNSDSFVWKAFTKEQKNPYWVELEHYHNFGRKRFYSFLIEQGFDPINYSVSTRYRMGMEIISRKRKF